MKREIKVGMVVSGSFLGLVGVVLATQLWPPAGSPESGTAEPPKQVAQVAPAKPAAPGTSANPAAPGSKPAGDESPPLSLPNATNANTASPAPVAPNETPVQATPLTLPTNPNSGPAAPTGPQELATGQPPNQGHDQHKEGGPAPLVSPSSEHGSPALASVPGNAQEEKPKPETPPAHAKEPALAPIEPPMPGHNIGALTNPPPPIPSSVPLAPPPSAAPLPPLTPEPEGVKPTPVGQVEEKAIPASPDTKPKELALAPAAPGTAAPIPPGGAPAESVAPPPAPMVKETVIQVAPTPSSAPIPAPVLVTPMGPKDPSSSEFIQASPRTPPLQTPTPSSAIREEGSVFIPKQVPVAAPVPRPESQAIPLTGAPVAPAPLPQSSGPVTTILEGPKPLPPVTPPSGPTPLPTSPGVLAPLPMVPVSGIAAPAAPPGSGPTSAIPAVPVTTDAHPMDGANKLRPAPVSHPGIQQVSGTAAEPVPLVAPTLDPQPLPLPPTDKAAPAPTPPPPASPVPNPATPNAVAPATPAPTAPLPAVVPPKPLAPLSPQPPAPATPVPTGPAAGPLPVVPVSPVSAPEPAPSVSSGSVRLAPAGPGPGTPIQPANAVVPVAVSDPQAGAKPPALAASKVERWDDTIHVVAQGDTFQTISKSAYTSDVYAEALQAYNADHEGRRARPKDGVLIAGEMVFIPPAYVLQQRYGDRIRSARPAAAPAPVTPAPAAVAPAPLATPAVGLVPPPAAPAAPIATTPTQASAPAPIAPTVATGDQGAYPIYKVRESKEMLYTIALRYLGDGNRWTEIQRLNPTLNAEAPLLPGTPVLMPPATKVPDQK